ncbi:hypothetical protein BT96DRAFT_948583 [Gymnopus androsaceus JB14]|uniref:Uncharacterized protein n=1 Tax=Gymnopus androsaceus JB14 TaxID=1447944 RepID=A0A6A4GNK4_9AGAR|nr:hypothetical protein BT96DRAFT_948583 [Gymnopus androsaceus JB14]
MNHCKLNVLFQWDYMADSGGESDDNYEPSQLLTPTKKRRYNALLSQQHDMDLTLLPPRSSALASMEANEHIANSGVINNNVGSQEFFEDLFALRGLDSSLFKNPANFDNDQINVDSTVQLEEDPEVEITDALQKALELLNPSNLKECEWLVGIEALQKKMVEALSAARQELEEACAAQKKMEQHLELANTSAKMLWACGSLDQPQVTWVAWAAWVTRATQVNEGYPLGYPEVTP